MALQAPERRTNLEEDLARALALSRADKRLGDYFPAVGDVSSAWHFDGSEHAGGGFDQDQYAYHDRKSARREWEVSVVQYARERELRDHGWEAEQEWREVGSVHAMEEAEVERAKRRQEDAWLREQHVRREPALKARPRQRSAAEILASRSTTLHADDLAAARTSAWANGLRFVGDGLAAEGEDDPTEPAQLRRIPSKHKDFSYTSSSEASVDYREQLYNPHSPNGSMYTPLSRSASYSSILNIPPPRHHSDGVRRNVSIDSSSRPPTLPSKHPAQRQRNRPPKERMESIVVMSTEEHGDAARPPSWSTMDTRPEDIRVFSPSHPSEGTIAHIKSRPGSTRRASRQTPIEENYVFIDDEKSNRSSTPEDDKKNIPSPLDDRDISVFHVPSTQISYNKTHSSAMPSIKKDDTIELARGVPPKLQNRLSKSRIDALLSTSGTIAGPVASPPARHITGTTLNNPEVDSPQSTNLSQLQESLPLTINEVWGISRDWESKESSDAQFVDIADEQASEATPTPTPTPAPVTLPQVNVDKSLPGTPYTLTHSTVSLYQNPSVESFALLRRPLSGCPGSSTGAPGSEPLVNSPSGSSTDRPQRSSPVTPNSQQSEQSYPVDMLSPTETPVAGHPRSSTSIPSSNSSDTIRVSPQNGHQRGYSEGSIRPAQPIVQTRNEKKLPPIPIPMQAYRFAPQTGDPFVYTGPRPIMSHADRESAVRLAADSAKPRSLSPISDEEEYIGRSGAAVRQSAHTFGNPDGRHSQVAFDDTRDSRTWRHIPADSKATIPPSLAPSMKSARTRASTLRASMRSPLPGISEKDTNSECSWGGEGGHYGTTSGLHTATWAAESVEDELIRGDVQEIGVYPVDPWAPSGVLTSGSSRHTRSRSEGSSYRQPSQDGNTLGNSPRSGSSDGRGHQSSFGRHGNNLGASSEWLCPQQNIREVEWPEFNEEENMAGVGAHFRRAHSTSKGSS